MQREAFRKKPAEAFRKAEKNGSCIIRDKSGKVHSIISVPKDDRPIVR